MKTILIILFVWTFEIIGQSKILIYMDLAQNEHLKAYGITFNYLEKGGVADWLLNYRGGSFMIDFDDELALRCRIKGVSFTSLNSSQVIDIYNLVQSENENMEVVRL